MTSPTKNMIPSVVQVSVTDRCQCSCRHCGVSLFRSQAGKGEPSLERLKSVFADLKRCGCSNVDLFGGEPTLRRDLFSVVRLAKSFSFDVYLETNGLLVDARYASGLKAAGLDLAHLSLDSHLEGVHDQGRGVTGAFRGAVRAMGALSAAGIPVHVSFTARDPGYFTGGGMNEFAAFCLDRGAEKIRILFPSCVGNWAARKGRGPSREQELGLFAFVRPEYREHMYVEAMGHNASLGEETKCPAKSIFCHITTAGLVLPCPYLPLAFGDIRRESLLSIFARIQGHPLMKETGAGCPSRDSRFVKKRLGGLGRGRPLSYVECANKVDLGGPCSNRCGGCARGAALSEAAAAAAIRAVDKGYSTIEIFGGEPALREDFVRLLGAVPAGMGVVLHSNARLFAYPDLARRVAGFRIACVKVPVFSARPAAYEAASGVKGSFMQMAAGIRNLSAAGIPVSLYLPERESAGPWRRLAALGASSVSTYTRTEKDPLPDSVLCFGEKLGELRVLWLRR
jgi:MoaA/NifB/PqqE/SkfB family radical SAM enzyme